MPEWIEPRASGSHSKQAQMDDREAVESNTDLRRRNTATEVTNKKETKAKMQLNRAQPGLKTWEDIPKNASNDIVHWLAKICQRKS